MAYCGVAVLLLACLATPVTAVTLKTNASAKGGGSGCDCLPWNEVYRNHGVVCGQGMEFYAWLGNTEALRPDDKRLKEVKYNIGDEFCTKFFEKLEGNRAVKVKFNTPPSEFKKPWDQSWCYTSPECAREDLNGGGYVPKKTVHWKYADNEHDVILKEMHPRSLMRLAAKEAGGTGVDMSILTGYAYYMSVSGDGDEINPEDRKVAENFQRKQDGKFMVTVLQPANHLAPRMLVMGREAYKMKQNIGHQTKAPGSWWAGFKILE